MVERRSSKTADEFVPEWQRGRKVCDGELEAHLGEQGKIFSRFDIMYRGLFKTIKTGTFKCIVRLTPKEQEFWTPLPAQLGDLLSPDPYEVRVYVLAATNLMPGDSSNSSDPYLKVSLGHQTLGDRNDHLDGVVNANFYQSFVLGASLPGAAKLRIEVWDYDLLTQDDLIGATEIDLEERVFSPDYRRIQSKPPIEMRELRGPTSTQSQGTIKMFIDIVCKTDIWEGDGGREDEAPAAVTAAVTRRQTLRQVGAPQTAEERAESSSLMEEETRRRNASGKLRPPPPPLWDIQPPNAQEWELRVIVWGARDVACQDLNTIDNMNDLYVVSQYAGSKKQETDTHWRSKGGEAQWNWRQSFPLTLGHERKPKERLRLQLWDRDVTNFDDCVGECTLDLRAWFADCYWQRVANEVSEETVPSSKEEGKTKGMRARRVERFQFDGSAVERMMQKRYKRNGNMSKAVARGALGAVAKLHGTLDKLDSSLQANTSHNPNAGARGEKKIEKLTNKVWLPVMPQGADGDDNPDGWVQISLELVDGHMARNDPVGTGRALPNKQPYLPPPLGRVKLTLNPFGMCYQLLGPKLCVRVACPLCCACCCMLIIVLAPFLLQLSTLSTLVSSTNNLKFTLEGFDFGSGSDSNSTDTPPVGSGGGKG